MPFAFGFPRAWSITLRLTILYSLLTLIVLVSVSGTLYWILARNMAREDNQFLVDKIYVLRTILKERPESIDALKEEVEWEVAARRFEKYYARILDEQGGVLIETPGMKEIVTSAMFPKPISANEMPESGVERKGQDGRPFLVMAAWVGVGKMGAKKRLHQVVLDVSHEEAILANYRRNMMIMILLGTLISAFMGIFVARNGMRPLEEITGAIQRITASYLNKLIGPAQWPKELATLAAAFDEMLKRLEDSFIRLSQFSSDLAHELRTPINNLMGEAEVALSQNRSAKEYRQVIESGLEEYARLSRMIDGLLFLARAESTDTRINKCSFDARKELEAVREFYDALAKEKEIAVTCQGNSLINADPTLFRRAVSNLLSNALQYTPQGGLVSLLVKKADNQSIEVIVSDTGIGISQEHLPKVLDRFYRADPARSQHPQGTGLGLSIVKSIMELHHGSVHITSELSKGTTVTLCFSQSS